MLAGGDRKGSHAVPEVGLSSPEPSLSVDCGKPERAAQGSGSLPCNATPFPCGLYLAPSKERFVFLGGCDLLLGPGRSLSCGRERWGQGHREGGSGRVAPARWGTWPGAGQCQVTGKPLCSDVQPAC